MGLFRKNKITIIIVNEDTGDIAGVFECPMNKQQEFEDIAEKAKQYYYTVLTDAEKEEYPGVYGFIAEAEIEFGFKQPNSTKLII